MQSHHRIYTDETLHHRDILLNSAHATVNPTLVVCYHAHCSIAYMGCLIIQVVLQSLVTEESQNIRQDTEEGGTLEGKRSSGWEKANKKRRKGESTYIDGM